MNRFNPGFSDHNSQMINNQRMQIDSYENDNPLTTYFKHPSLTEQKFGPDVTHKKADVVFRQIAEVKQTYNPSSDLIQANTGWQEGKFNALCNDILKDIHDGL